MNNKIMSYLYNTELGFEIDKPKSINIDEIINKSKDNYKYIKPINDKSFLDHYYNFKIKKKNIFEIIYIILEANDIDYEFLYDKNRYFISKNNEYINELCFDCRFKNGFHFSINIYEEDSENCIINYHYFMHTISFAKLYIYESIKNIIINKIEIEDFKNENLNDYLIKFDK
jgi:hypothetical protein